MAGIKLQKILGPRKPAVTAIAGLLTAMGGPLRVEDEQGCVLVGTEGDQDGLARYPVVVDGETLGYARGPAAQGESLAGLLSFLMLREAETKQLGTEVLNVYREINLIHRFSERLATLLDKASVAEASVEQACQLVKSSLGAILLLNDDSGIYEAVVCRPPAGAFKSGIAEGKGLIGGIAARGNAEIVNDVFADPRFDGKELTLSSVICVPLKLKDRIRGILVVGSAEPIAYTAGDLKLMSTLGLQTAAALENTLLYEKTLAAARMEKAEAMLLNILPASVAQELLQTGSVQPMYFPDVTVCFTDFVGFSKSTMMMAAEEVVQELNEYFTAFDRIVERYGLEKLKTIGDSYMCVSGLPKRREGNPVDAVLAAMDMVETVRNMGSRSGVNWKVRVGVHTGPVIAGVVGINKFAFDIWGETVNLASRMESCGEANRVNISEITFKRVKDFMVLEPRGRVKTKEGQDIEMYFVEGVLEKLLADRSACPPPEFERRYKRYFEDKTPSFPRHLMASEPARESVGESQKSD